MSEMIWGKSVWKKEGHGMDRYLKQATMSMSISMDGGEDKKMTAPVNSQ